MAMCVAIGRVAGAALLGLTVLAAPARAVEPEALEPRVPQAAVEQATDAEAQKGALSLPGGGDTSAEPIYAGTSMWFLLSIALLSSIAVKRRANEPE